MESGNEVLLEPETANFANPEKLKEVDEDVESSKNVDNSKTQSSSKKGKVAKNGPSTGTFGRTPRPSLSHSSSFPAKTRTPDSTKPRVVEPTSSTSASSRSANRTSSGLKVIKTALLDIEDDGASSTASPNATSTPGTRRRNSTSGFAFRLDERAERRKQFYSKMEEKVQAKEVEKSNLQAKSKESQEQEIKKLRKSLTFKATPMPNFYKEPLQKPQLKKIPTTRAVSPKLGRNKSNVGAVSKSLEHMEIANSPRATRDQTMSPRLNLTNRDKHTAAFKQPNRKSLTKLSEVKSSKAKEKVLTAEAIDEKVGDEQVQEIEGPSVGSHQVEGCLEGDTVQESGFDLSSANQDATPVDTVGEVV